MLDWTHNKFNIRILVVLNVKKERFTVKQFHELYPNDDACLHQVFINRYAGLTSCPDCGEKFSFHKITGRKCYACAHCGYQLHPLANTIFHKSSTELKNWFFAIFLFSCSKNGVSAKELQRQLGVTYKCAHRMAKQIRKLFDESVTPLRGTIEVDETLAGGKKKSGKRGRGAAGKTVVFGMLEKSGNIATHVVPDVKRKTLYPIIEDSIAKGSTIHSDELRTYATLALEGYNHQTVNHGRGEYVRDSVHVNGLEGFWSQLKRSINGTYHAVSPKYLQQYANEFAYRYNRRNDVPALFHSMINRVWKLA